MTVSRYFKEYGQQLQAGYSGNGHNCTVYADVFVSLPCTQLHLSCVHILIYISYTLLPVKDTCLSLYYVYNYVFLSAL
ncbi:MAG TPA: hypothetical protein DCL73_12610 [Treponema sp.]|nr:hypothetical protein [Treponema sp.]